MNDDNFNNFVWRTAFKRLNIPRTSFTLLSLDGINSVCISCKAGSTINGELAWISYKIHDKVIINKYHEAYKLTKFYDKIKRIDIYHCDSCGYEWSVYEC